MILNAPLLYSAAQQIDALDAEARDIADQKKDIFDNIKQSQSKDQYDAWRAAVKKRQKRRGGKDAIEAHEAATDAMLIMLEGPTPQPAPETASRASSVAGNNVSQFSTRTGANGGGN